jgi:hypothetical protein
MVNPSSEQNVNADGHKRNTSQKYFLNNIGIEERRISMKKENNWQADGNSRGLVPGKALLIGVAGGLAALAWLSMGSQRRKTRRYADRAEDRRNPMHFFLAGRYPQRREIDCSGERPLFERRQSVYDAY